jgi:hypothetical protein
VFFARVPMSCRLLVVMALVVGVKGVYELVALEILWIGVGVIRRGNGGACGDDPNSETSAQ